MKQGYISLLLLFFSFYSQGQNLLSLGFQNPEVIRQDNIDTYTNNFSTILTNHYLKIRPYFEYHTHKEERYDTYKVAIEVEQLYFKNFFDNKGIDTFMGYGENTLNKRTLYIEYGRGTSFNIRTSMLNGDLKFVLGYQWKYILTQKDETFRPGYFKITSYHESISPKFLIIGLSSNLNYHQRISDRFFLFTSANIYYTIWKSITKPKQYSTQINNGTVISENHLISEKVNNWVTRFYLFPGFGISYKLK